ncbi:hypothetical protein CJU89_6452 [Yarrowia sp. B02]|nr:hypothetical protein CJU89_6452 [Yarrowia sp. B02]
MSGLAELTDGDALDILNTLGQLKIKKSDVKPDIVPSLSTLPIELIAEIAQYLDLYSAKQLFLSRVVPQADKVDRNLTDLVEKVLIPQNIVPIKSDGDRNDWKKTLGTLIWMKSKAFIDGARMAVLPPEESLGYVVDFKNWTFACVQADYKFRPPGEVVATVQYFDETLTKVYLTLDQRGDYHVHRVRSRDDIVSLRFDGPTSPEGEAKLPPHVNNVGEVLLHYDHQRDEGDGWPDFMGDQYVIDWEQRKFRLVKTNVTM